MEEALSEAILKFEGQLWSLIARFLTCTLSNGLFFVMGHQIICIFPGVMLKHFLFPAIPNPSNYQASTSNCNIDFLQRRASPAHQIQNFNILGGVACGLHRSCVLEK